MPAISSTPKPLEFDGFPLPTAAEIEVAKKVVDWAGIRKRRQNVQRPLEIWTPEEIWKSVKSFRKERFIQEIKELIGGHI